ncbi:MAG: glycosyltransferase [Bacteroidales bacterium]|nr:glycosyltransferase [Candidatus Physcousia equi]
MLYILIGISLILCAICLLCNTTFRKIANAATQTQRSSAPDGKLPGITIIITAHNQEEQLRRHLPLILNQIHPDYEVIIVDMNSTDGTKKLLEQMEEGHFRLRHTFIPSSACDISQQRLAITLGAKAAQKPWLLLTTADCVPISHLWLQRMGEALLRHRSAMMVMGHTRYKGVKGLAGRRMSFFRLWQNVLTYRLVSKAGLYRSDGTNLLYNKDFFLSHHGFADHSNLLVGATDIMVNRHSTRHNAEVCLHPEAMLEQEMPHKSHWKNDRLFFRQTRAHFKQHYAYRLRYFFRVLVHALFMLSLISSLALSVYLEAWWLTAVPLLLWLIHITAQGIFFNAASQALNNRRINPFRIAWFVHLIPFWDAYTALRYTFTDKRTFRKKYI